MIGDAPVGSGRRQLDLIVLPRLTRLLQRHLLAFFIKTEEEGEGKLPFGAVVDGRVYRLKLKTFAALLCCIHRHFSAGSRTCVRTENSSDQESFTRKNRPTSQLPSWWMSFLLR